LAAKGYKLELSLAALDIIADAGFDPVYGARPLKRAIQNEIENPLAHKLLSGDLPVDAVIKIDVDESGLVIH
jgi:ATP-dependent Clp protease ATP-binding subunit ClpB